MQFGKQQIDVYRWHRAAAVAVLLAAAVLGALVGEPGERTQIGVLAVGVVLVGTPHGGLDHRLGRRVLWPMFGDTWPLAFAVCYLGLAAATVALWSTSPAVGLGVFLAMSWAHFGDASAAGRWSWVERFARGGVPIVVPALAHPDDIANIFYWLAGTDGAAVEDILRGPLAWLWVPALGLYLVGAAAAREPAAVETAALAVAAVALPPLLSFTLYFCLVHAPRAMIEAGRSSREGISKLLRAAAPLSLAAAAAAAAGYVVLAAGAPAEVAAVRTIFIWLAALTVPHMLLAAATPRIGQASA